MFFFFELWKEVFVDPCSLFRDHFVLIWSQDTVFVSSLTFVTPCVGREGGWRDISRKYWTDQEGKGGKKNNKGKVGKKVLISIRRGR